ncbi:DHA1 family inner membrane transport protein [Humitalea rosea]|uniref:DHA1 family inner membrane transport protein n=1 Tax=Humitalea rosea TaxID=990373 RepID=A0A2W7IJ01_9PROT|nr:MFS transporter [Humitalea rosea]PZW45644.1 DHA1 family inner membrane transport protein [Humitalea rosea]
MTRNLPLLALAIGAFGIGTTEFAPMGLLPVIAGDLGVSIPSAGLLVSAYAFGVLLGAPLMTLTTGGLRRKTLLLLLMGLFTLGNLLSALAPGYGTLLAARLVTSLCHGAFFGVGSIVAANLVPPEKRAGAVAAMFMGLTIANVGGVPLATWFGQVAGWRAAFWGITGLGVLALAALHYALPRAPVEPRADIGRELRVLRRPAVLLALATTVLSSSAMFTAFTYIAPILQEVTRVSPAFVTQMLVLFGLGLTLGNYLGGRFADRALNATLVTVLAAITALLLIFAVTMHWALPAAVTIFVWGVATFAMVPPLQTRVMRTASDAPNLASSVNIGAFNLGNALGAVLGGAVIGVGLSYEYVAVAAAVPALAALGLVLVSIRGRRPVPAEALCAES